MRAKRTAGGAASSTATSATSRLANAISRITVPTLGVHAADDPLASYDDASAMIARSPGSHWVHVGRGGHIFIDEDERAKREIAAFLAAHGPSRSPEVTGARKHALAP